MSRQAVHYNGHLPCAIDTETTGLTPGLHDIIQIAIIPLAPDFTPAKELPFFEMRLKPKRPENASLGAFKVNKSSLESAMRHGIDPWDAVDRFEEWVAKLNLPEKKQLVPVGHGYINYDRLMIREWLGGTMIPTKEVSGWASYNHFFHGHARDTMHICAYLNDCAYWQQEAIPFPKLSLGFICSVLKVPLLKAHDALSDAIASAECYRRLMKHLRANLPDGLMPHISGTPSETPETHEHTAMSGQLCHKVAVVDQILIADTVASLDEEHKGCPV